MESLLTSVEVAKIFKTSPETVRYWRHKGYGPKGIKVGRRVLYDQAEVERWLDQLRSGAADAGAGS